MMTGLEFPDISPIMFSIGPVAVRWYSMAYLFGILAGWYLINRNVKKYDLGLSRTNVEDMVFYLTLGIILGGRLGYVLFYGKGYFWENPLRILEIWQGGMSFHWEYEGKGENARTCAVANSLDLRAVGSDNRRAVGGTFSERRLSAAASVAAV